MSERKRTLIEMIERLDPEPTPGQKVAMEIAIALVRRASVKEISKLAESIEDADIFWERQWR